MTETAKDQDLLSSHRIPTLPPSFFYIPNFLSIEEEAHLLAQIPSNRWITLSHRRLQAHPSKLTATNTLLAAPLPRFLADPIVPRFAEFGVFTGTPHGTPNHVLLNEYKRGEGIMLHEDGAAYAPVVATVSLDGSVVFDLVKKQGAKENTSEDRSEGEEHGDEMERGEPTRYRILQEPRSLLVTRGRAYSEFLHGIADVERDEELSPDTIVNWGLLGNADEFKSGINERGTRISLTYRDVLKVSKVGSKILGMGKR